MRSMISAAAVAAALLTISQAQAAQDGVELGVLDCVIEGGAGMIITSTKDLRCTFTPTDSKFGPEAYFGVVRKYGLDVGATGDVVMKWLVLAPVGNKYAAGALAGDYVGASAGATVGVGAGANVLIGGSESAFSLQPISVEAQTGLNVALGVSQFQLRSAN